MNSSTELIDLDSAPLNTALAIVSDPCSPDMAHRLHTLGWRIGAPVRVLKKTSGGAKIVELSAGRVAIARKLAKTLQVIAI